MSFEIQLANGKSLKSENPEEIYWFEETSGESITEPLPPSKEKRNANRKRVDLPVEA